MTSEEIEKRGYKPVLYRDAYISKWRSCEECCSIRIGLYEKTTENGALMARVFCKENGCHWYSEPLKQSKNQNKRSTKWANKSRKYREQHPLCEVCGAPSEIVHHKRPWACDEDQRFNDNNLIALCRQCHKKEHQKIKNGGKKDETGTRGSR